MRYMKRPIVIEAIRWDGPDHDVKTMPEWLRTGPCLVTQDGFLLIQTLEGNIFASPGDWIIKGIMGEIYPCKHDIFEATYQKVEET